MRKFAKTLMIGTLISAGISMMYTESNNWNKRKVMKRGKQFIKNMGIM